MLSQLTEFLGAAFLPKDKEGESQAQAVAHTFGKVFDELQGEQAALDQKVTEDRIAEIARPETVASDASQDSAEDEVEERSTWDSDELASPPRQVEPLADGSIADRVRVEGHSAMAGNEGMEHSFATEAKEPDSLQIRSTDLPEVSAEGQVRRQLRFPENQSSTTHRLTVRGEWRAPQGQAPSDTTKVPTLERAGAAAPQLPDRLSTIRRSNGFPRATPGMRPNTLTDSQGTATGFIVPDGEGLTAEARAEAKPAETVAKAGESAATRPSARNSTAIPFPAMATGKTSSNDPLDDPALTPAAVADRRSPPRLTVGTGRDEDLIWVGGVARSVGLRTDGDVSRSSTGDLPRSAEKAPAERSVTEAGDAQFKSSVDEVVDGFQYQGSSLSGTERRDGRSEVLDDRPAKGAPTGRSSGAFEDAAIRAVDSSAPPKVRDSLARGQPTTSDPPAEDIPAQPASSVRRTISRETIWESSSRPYSTGDLSLGAGFSPEETQRAPMELGKSISAGQRRFSTEAQLRDVHYPLTGRVVQRTSQVALSQGETNRIAPPSREQRWSEGATIAAGAEVSLQWIGRARVTGHAEETFAQGMPEYAWKSEPLGSAKIILNEQAKTSKQMSALSEATPPMRSETPRPLNRSPEERMSDVPYQTREPSDPNSVSTSTALELPSKEGLIRETDIAESPLSAAIRSGVFQNGNGYPNLHDGRRTRDISVRPLIMYPEVPAREIGELGGRLGEISTSFLTTDPPASDISNQPRGQGARSWRDAPILGRQRNFNVGSGEATDAKAPREMLPRLQERAEDGPQIRPESQPADIGRAAPRLSRRDYTVGGAQTKPLHDAGRYEDTARLHSVNLAEAHGDDQASTEAQVVRTTDTKGSEARQRRSDAAASAIAERPGEAPVAADPEGEPSRTPSVGIPASTSSGWDNSAQSHFAGAGLSATPDGAGSPVSPLGTTSEGDEVEHWIPGTVLQAEARSPVTGSMVTQAAPLPRRGGHDASVVRQLAEALLAGDSGREDILELKLRPEELGHLRFRMTQGEHGLVLSIAAERPETLDLLRRNVDQLARALSDLGYESSSFSFDDNPSENREWGGSSPAREDHGGNSQEIPAVSNAPLAVAAPGLDIRI